MTDREIIHALGGVTLVAKKIGVSVGVVGNWLRRGIPAQRKLDHPELFLNVPQSNAKTK